MTQILVLLAALPVQLALIPLNARTGWLTPGELRFWTVAIFVVFVVLISLSPVLAPIALIGLGIWWMARRRKSPPPPPARVEPTLAE